LNITHPKDEILLAPSSVFSREAFIILNSSFFSDLVAVHNLQRACFGRDAWDYIDLISMFLTPGMVHLKAVMNNQVVGFVVGDPNRWERVGWIATIGVHPAYRQRGIGTALLAKCEEKLRESKIKLTVRASNTTAISLYRKQGYAQVGIWQRYYAGGEDGVVMEKTTR
jgi:ribosomal-protein-alanine N-acetyltransferase